MSPATGYAKRPWSGQRRSNWQGQTAPTSAPTVPEKAVLKGSPNLWLTLQSISKGKTSKTTKAMRVPGGLLISTTTIGQIFAAEALCFLPGADVVKTADGGGAIVARTEGST
jgi:hypothetical protein